ncbi:hypothetical protein ACOSQ2_015140 [Xanthoceras sorbifolium]
MKNYVKKGHIFRCDPDSNATYFQGSSDYDNEQIFSKYCTRHQWAPNPNGTAVKGYAIYEGFRLKKIKNNSRIYTVTCKNELHDSFRVRSLGKEWPKASKRYSFRHMLANFKCAFKNHKLNGKLWHTARVKSVVDFKEALKSVGQDSVDASDHITNNMFDCFNGWIKDERDKPILTLLELLKRKIMVRFCEKWEELKKWNDSITLYARE